jgi:hypothetical protein
VALERSLEMARPDDIHDRRLVTVLLQNRGQIENAQWLEVPGLDNLGCEQDSHYALDAFSYLVGRKPEEYTMEIANYSRRRETM